MGGVPRVLRAGRCMRRDPVGRVHSTLDQLIRYESEHTGQGPCHGADGKSPPDALTNDAKDGAIRQHKCMLLFCSLHGLE